MIKETIAESIDVIAKQLREINRAATHRSFIVYSDPGLDNEKMCISISYLFETSKRYQTLRFDLDTRDDNPKTLYSVLIKDFSNASIAFALTNVREYARKFLCALDWN
jgi:hypothetical protein